MKDHSHNRAGHIPLLMVVGYIHRAYYREARCLMQVRDLRLYFLHWNFESKESFGKNLFENQVLALKSQLRSVGLLFARN